MPLQFPPSGFTDQTATRNGVTYASWLRRAGGWFIDVLLVTMIRYLLVSVLSVFGSFSSAGTLGIVVSLILYASVAVVYSTLCLANLHGQTPGMRAVRIRCVPASRSGGLTFAQALARSLTNAGVEIVIAIIGAYTFLGVLLLLVAYLWPLVDTRRQTWWDKAAATVVLSDRGW
jgi:uncharacterized RDD family membrane protein YckC